MSKLSRMGKHSLQFIICLSAILLSAYYVFSFQAIQTNEFDGNPNGCPYYITMESLLANYRMMSLDSANAKFIKNKMLRFENDLQKRSLNPLVQGYEKNYYATLLAHNVNSINKVNDISLLIALAQQSYKGMDQFYLDEKLFCINPLYDPIKNGTRMMFYYHLGGLYNNLFPDLYTRVLFAVKSWEGTAVFPGFFVNNQTTILDTRFLVGMPLLTALYILPGYDFKGLGVYGSMMPWNDLGSLNFTDSKLRKILDISGIDAFTLSQLELSKQSKSKGSLEIKNATRLKNESQISINKPDYITYINTNSYGMAYLASKITYVDQNEIAGYEKAIKKYYSHPNDQDQVGFRSAQQALYAKLYKLRDKHEVILESKLPFNYLNTTQGSLASGTVNVNGIVGERAFFTADCLQSSCTFVANISDAPGWHAFVNKHEHKIERANFAFISTTIPNGKYGIWLIYSPLSSLLSYLLSLICLIAIVRVSIKPYKS